MPKLNYPQLINPRNDGLTFRQFHIGHNSQFGFKILNFQCNFRDFFIFMSNCAIGPTIMQFKVSESIVMKTLWLKNDWKKNLIALFVQFGFNLAQFWKKNIYTIEIFQNWQCIHEIGFKIRLMTIFMEFYDSICYFSWFSCLFRLKDTREKCRKILKNYFLV